MASRETVNRPVWTGSIRAKLLVYAAAVLAIPILLYGVLVYRAARDALEPTLAKLIADDAVATELRLRQLLGAQRENLTTWANVDIMRELVVRDVDKTISRFLSDIRQDYGTYLEVVALDADGACVAASAPALIGRSFADSFPPNGSQSRIHHSRRHRKFYLPLSLPIPNPDDAVQDLGTLVGLLDITALESVVRAPSGHVGMRLRLIDERGRVVAGPEVSPAATSLPAWEIERSGSVASSGGDDGIVYTATNPLGEELIIAESPLRLTVLDQHLEWSVLASLPRESALAPIRDVRRQILVIGSCITALGLLAAWLLSTHLARPVRELTLITSRIAEKGTLEDIPEPGSNDEIGELTRSFQAMVTKISSAHEELVQSAKLSFLGELAAGIAHEIRTPLGIIKNSAQLLERSVRKEEGARELEFAHFIYEESDRLNAIVTDLLNFARPSPLERVPTDLNEVVERAAQFLRTEASQRRVQLEVSLPPEPVIADCDARQIYQVCLNLLLNAIRVCQAGDHVEVSTKSVGGDACIVVSDDGPGIPDEIRDRLFVPFVSQREGGIGLGLAIVERIVSAHGGRVEAGEAPEGGASFHVRIPGGTRP